MAEYERQHYIPQFLIKNFSKGHDGYVEYVDKKTKNTTNVKTEEIFFYRNLYDDSKNRTGLKQTEINFARQENEAKKIIDKFLTGREIIVSKEEYIKLILFLNTLIFRNKKGLWDTRKHSGKDDVEFLKHISQDIENSEEAWRLILNDYSNIQNIEDLNDFHKASKSVRFQLKYLIANYHINAFECKEGSLVLSDILSVSSNFDSIIGDTPALTFIPISQTRLLVIALNRLPPSKAKKGHIPTNKFALPLSNRTHMFVRVSTLYKKQVDELNKALTENCMEGYVI